MSKDDTFSGSHSPRAKTMRPDSGREIKYTAASGISARPLPRKQRDNDDVMSVKSSGVVSIASSRDEEIERLRCA